MAKTGRPSIIVEYNLQIEIEALRNSGKTYKEIEEALNITHPDISISDSTIARYFSGGIQALETEKPIELVELSQDVFADLYFKIRQLSSLSNNDRVATNYMKTKQHRLESGINKHFRLHPEDISTGEEKSRNFIIDISRQLDVDTQHTRAWALYTPEDKAKARRDKMEAKEMHEKMGDWEAYKPLWSHIPD